MFEKLESNVGNKEDSRSFSPFPSLQTVMRLFQEEASKYFLVTPVNCKRVEKKKPSKGKRNDEDDEPEGDEDFIQVFKLCLK